MKFNPEYPGFIAIWTLKRCTLMHVDPKSSAIINALKLDLMFEQLGGGLFIKDV